MSYVLGALGIAVYGLACFYFGFREGFDGGWTSALDAVREIVETHPLGVDAKQELPQG